MDFEHSGVGLGLEVPSWSPSGHKATSVHSHATSTVTRVPGQEEGSVCRRGTGWGRRAGRTVWSRKLTFQQGRMGTCPAQCCKRDRESWGSQATQPALGAPGGQPGGLSVHASASSAGSAEKRLRAPGFKASHQLWDLRQRWHLPKAPCLEPG